MGLFKPLLECHFRCSLMAPLLLVPPWISEPCRLNGSCLPQNVCLSHHISSLRCCVKDSFKNSVVISEALGLHNQNHILYCFISWRQSSGRDYTQADFALCICKLGWQSQVSMSVKTGIHICGKDFWRSNDAEVTIRLM